MSVLESQLTNATEIENWRINDVEGDLDGSMASNR